MEKQRVFYLDNAATTQMSNEVYREMIERDKNDSTRSIAPCVQAKDAILVDNSKLSEAETVETILKIVKKKRKV